MNRPARLWSRAIFGVIVGIGIVGAAFSCGDGDSSVSASSNDDGSAVQAPPFVPAPGSDGAGGDADPTDAAVALDAEYLGPGAACDDDAGDAGLGCLPGWSCCPTCCLAGNPSVCTNVAAPGQCPLPDLLVSRVALGTGITVATLEAGTCELTEGCLADAGLRRVMKFDVRVQNRGNADLVLGSPDGSPEFQYSPCHMHYHFSDFATYRLLDDAGATVVTGRKQAFCARDSDRIDPAKRPTPRYDCNSQGISVGWDDDYGEDLPCQWLDVTDVPSGTYTLEVEVNPVRKITESSYTNNVTRVSVTLP